MKLINKIMIYVLCLCFGMSLFTGCKKIEDQKHTEEQEIVQIIDVKTSINNFSVTDNGETYNVMLVDGMWFSPENSNAYLDNEYISTMIDTLCSLSAIIVEENAKDISIYGLDNPTSLIEFADESENVFKLKFGNKVPTGSGYYFMLNDQKTVYKVNDSDYTLLCGGFDSIRNKKLFVVKKEDIYSVSVSNPNTSFTIRPKTFFDKNAHSSSQWEMSAPYLKDVNQYIFENDILNVLDFTIYEFVDDNPADYSKYGLENPKYTIKVTTNMEINFLLGDSCFSTDDTNTKLVYMMVQGVPNVFAIREDQVSYKDMTPVDVLDSLVFSRILACVESINYTDANASHILKAKEPNFYINDKNVEEEAFRNVYTQIISPTILGEVGSDVGTELCRMTFNYNTETPSETIVFNEYGDLYAAATINGRTEFYVNRSSVKDMMDAINKLAE